MMALAPIRGAPPGAPNPDFPTEKPTVKPAPPIAAPASVDQPPTPPARLKCTPIQIGRGGVTFIFRIIPEQPAIARASMTIQVVVEAAGSYASNALAFLRMSAENARNFLTNVRDGRSPVVARGDEEGDVQIEYESTEAGPVLIVRKPGGGNTLRRCIINDEPDLTTIATELLADLGA
jgi:hypothetical protein